MAVLAVAFADLVTGLFLLLVSSSILFSLAYCMCRGFFPGRGGFVYRKENPIMFWALGILFGTFTIAAIALAARVVLQAAR